MSEGLSFNGLLSTQIGVAVGAVRPLTATALVSAGLLSVIIFPPIALAQLQRTTRRDQSPAPSRR